MIIMNHLICKCLDKHLGFLLCHGGFEDYALIDSRPESHMDCRNRTIPNSMNTGLHGLNNHRKSELILKETGVHLVVTY